MPTATIHQASQIHSAKRFSRFYDLRPFLNPILANEKTRAYTMLIFSLFSLAFFSFFAINPTITTIAELRKKVEDAGLVEKKLQTKINNLSMLQKTYPTIQGDIPTIFDALPPQGRPANLLGKIKALTTRSSIILTGMQVQQIPLSADPKSTEKASPFFFVITGTGTYEDTLTFLNNLSTFDRVVGIDGFTIARTQGKEQGKLLTFSMRGTSYVLFEK